LRPRINFAPEKGGSLRAIPLESNKIMINETLLDLLFAALYTGLAVAYMTSAINRLLG
jgi:hypothetical protein